MAAWDDAKKNDLADIAERYTQSTYAREELVAELGAAFLCADLGITPENLEDHADYIGHWLKVLQDDKHAIFQAAAHAQRAADYLQGLQPTMLFDPPDDPPHLILVMVITEFRISPSLSSSGRRRTTPERLLPE